jgi:hypothetical protein
MSMTVRELFRFFRVVPPVPSLMVVTFLAVTIVSVVAIAIDRSLVAGMLKAVLVVQLFAVSSGFVGHARRGHYDLLLTRGDDRVAVALVHWALSAAPGLASWLSVAAAEAAISFGDAGISVASGSIVAVVVVSTVPWALTAFLPRFAAAIGWLAVFAVGVAVRSSLPVALPLVTLVYPLAMVGVDVRSQVAATVLPLGVALLSVGGVLFAIRRVSIPLEGAQ